VKLFQRGWHQNARVIASPNYNQRPPGINVDAVVIHNISLPPGVFGGSDIEALFTNTLEYDAHPAYHQLRNLKVSAHFLIRRNGELIQFVATHLRAWHAGVSDYKGRQNWNDFSIGIELEGTDTLPYTASQYSSLARLIVDLQAIYPAIISDNIAGHQDIAPTRKTDPGSAFDWKRLRLTMEALDR